MQAETRSIYSVSEINRLLKGVLEEAFPNLFWVRGEIKGFRMAASGHRYFDLIEQVQGKTRAKLSCAFYAGSYRKFLKKIEEIGIESFMKDDIEVCLLGKVNFYEPYGKLSLLIQDVDPMYTLGKLSQLKKKNRALLQKEGIYTLNKQLPPPLVPLRIGLITAPNSAAEADFLKELSVSQKGFAVYISYALMQGKRTEVEVCQALSSLEKLPLDHICIVRGGGSFTDLSHFDALSIARAIALSKVPVIVGVGHEKDVSLADEVAYLSCKTPTKAAQVLVEQVNLFLAECDRMLSLILTQARQEIESHKKHLEGLAQSTIQRSSLSLEQKRTVFAKWSQLLLRFTQNYIQRRGERLRELEYRIHSALSLAFVKRDQRLREHLNRLKAAVAIPLFKRRGERVEEYFQRTLHLLHERLYRAEEQQKLFLAKIESRDPQAILRRGYALVHQDDTIIKRKRDLLLHHPIAVQFYDGTIQLNKRRLDGKTTEKL